MYPLETIVAWAKRRGFVYPGSDIYGWLANARDYGPYGSQLKKNIADLRWKTFVQEREDMIGLDSQILMHPKVREASGHVAGFNDPLIDDKNTGERFRADKLIEDELQKMRSGIIFDKKGNPQSNQDPRYLNFYSQVESELWISSIWNEDDRKKWWDRFEQLVIEYIWMWVNNLIPESRTFEQMKAFIINELPNNPNTNKKADWTDVRKFSMMFYTYQGVIHDEENKIWLRPETAQGIFVNFKNVIDTTRMRVPFGIGQIGKAFRNEITPGNFLYRTREFEQMEIEYFVENDPAKADEAFAGWRDASMRWRQDIMQFKAEHVRFRQHESDELSHYSAGTFDVEFQYPWWWGELQWIANRTDFDLKAHQEHSKQSMQYTDPYTGARYIPRVIEPSFGLSRTVLASMFDAYDEEHYTNSNGQEETRVVVRFPKQIAPVKVALFPLIKKDEQQVAIAQSLWKKLSKWVVAEYDDGGAIGKRYRRQDEIGTPWCITVDHDTVASGNVTIRDRDSMQQITLHIDAVVDRINKQLL